MITLVLKVITWQSLFLTCLFTIFTAQNQVYGTDPFRVRKKEPIDPRIRKDYIFHDDHNRTYYFAVPSKIDWDKKMPIIFLFHGAGGNINDLLGGIGGKLLEHCQKNNFILVMPMALDGHFNDGRFMKEANFQGKAIDDVGFIAKLTEYFQNNYNLHNYRKYLAGISNGGIFCHRLALEKPGLFAAMATICASLPEEIYEKYHSQLVAKDKIDILMINGTLDPIVKYEGGPVLVGKSLRGILMPVEKTKDFWLIRNGCKKIPEIFLKMPDPCAYDGSVPYLEKYFNPFDRRELRFIRIEGGGHFVPSLKISTAGILAEAVLNSHLGKACKDFEAADEIFNFFDGR